MIVSVNQPAYIPWLGYYQRIAVADVHVVLSHVQFEKGSFTNRNKVRTSQGWTWLSVPVVTSGNFGKLEISQLEIDNSSDWRSKHWKTIKINYGKAAYFKTHAEFFEAVYQQPWANLFELCRQIDTYLLAAFGIETTIVESTTLTPQGTKDDLVLDLCVKCGATRYLSGSQGRNYLQTAKFNAVGIEVEYQDYDHPIYLQAHTGPFEPFMSAIDLLFNAGPKSRDILMTSGHAK